MKKICFVYVMLFLGILSANAQFRNRGNRFVDREVVNATLSAGLPVGTASDISNVNLAGGLLFQTVVTESLNLTLSATYSHFIGKKVENDLVTIEYDDFSSVLLGAGARLFFSQDVAMGLELGYGIGINPDGNDGGFYYNPNLRYYVSEATNVFLSYTALTTNGDPLASINLGLEFGL